jgi:hypothetical protein
VTFSRPSYMVFLFLNNLSITDACKLNCSTVSGDHAALYRSCYNEALHSERLPICSHGNTAYRAVLLLLFGKITSGI